MLILQVVISCDNSQKVAQIHYLSSLWPHSKIDDDTTKLAAQSAVIKIIGKEQLHGFDHWVLARPFTAQVPYDEPVLMQPPHKFESMICKFEDCGLITVPMYNTRLSKQQYEIDLSADKDKKAPYRSPYHWPPKDDVELSQHLEKALWNGWIWPNRSHFG